MSKLRLEIIGNLGKDAVVNNVNGKNVINFNVAHTEKFKQADGTLKEKTTWVGCAYWTERTAVAPHLKQGTMVCVEGNAIDLGTYKHEASNSMVPTIKLRVNNVVLLGSKPKESTPQNFNAQQPQSNAVDTTQEFNEPMDDLPF